MLITRGDALDRGAVSVEVALIVPALLLLAALATASWRLHQVRGDAQSAAEVAARAVSVAAGPASGIAAGTRVARAELAGTDCRSPQVGIDPTGLSVPVGSAGSVSATVGCTVTMADLLAPGLPGSFHVSAQAGAPVDSHRERGS
ncbi:MAG: hypothetical protein LKI24_03365 [Acidipropionibacterium sp.]|jgi:Flp pilus assembly protein TadG|nr:hypothetical protein [Acidipropionibacterium sp.]